MNAYTPEGLAFALGQGFGTILVWVGVAVSAAIVLMLVYKGIRSGIIFFQIIAETRQSDKELYYDDDALSDDDYQAALDHLSKRHDGWIDTSGYDMGMEAPDVGTRPGN
jgi:hypothetical protein